MLGYYRDLDIPRVTLTEPEESFEFDVIELAGQIRHKIFHGGGRLDEANAPVRLQPAARLLAIRPDVISHILKRDCERAIAERARRTGPAWRAATDPNFTIQPPAYDVPGRPRLLVGASRTRGTGVATTMARADDLNVEFYLVSGANLPMKVEARPRS